MNDSVGIIYWVVGSERGNSTQMGKDIRNKWTRILL